MNTQGGKLEFEFDLRIEELEKKLHHVQAELGQVSGNLQKEGSKIDKAWAMGLAAISGLAIGRMIGNTMQDIIAIRGEFQKLEAVLTNSFGSSSRAKQSLEMIQQFASKTPFQVTDLTNSFVKLVNQGFTPSIKQMTALGDLASSTGKGFDQLTEAIIDAQTFEFERLKEFGIRASKEGNKVSFTFKDQKTIVDATAESIRNYVLSLGDMKGVKGSMKAISDTLVGQISNMKDAWDQFLNNIGTQSDGPFSSVITHVQELVGWLVKLTNIKGSDGLEKQNVELRVLSDLIEDSNTSQEHRNELIDEVNAKYSDYLPKLLDEKSSLTDLKTALDSANESMEHRIDLLITQEEMEALTTDALEKKRKYRELLKSQETIAQGGAAGTKEFLRQRGIDEGGFWGINKSTLSDRIAKASADADVAMAKLNSFRSTYENVVKETESTDKKTGGAVKPADQATSAAKNRLDIILDQTKGLTIQQQILRDIANEENKAAEEVSSAIKADYSSWGTEQEKIDRATAKAAKMQEKYDADQIASGVKKQEQIQFTIGLLSDMLGFMSGIAEEGSNASMAMSNLANALQSKSIAEGFAKFALTVIKDWIMTSQKLKEMKIQTDIDKVTASLERFTMQLNDANNAMGVEKAREYGSALKDLQLAAQQASDTFNNLSHNKRVNWFKDVKVDFNTPIEDLQKMLVQLEAMQNESSSKKVNQNTKDRIDMLKQLIDLKQQELDIDNKIREAVTGTTAQSIADAIMQGFEDGYSSIKDFGQTFEDIMKKSILNAFKVNMIEPYMDTYYREFTKAMNDGVMTDKEKDGLKLRWDGFLGKITTGMDGIDQILKDWGFDSTSSQNTLSGSIKGITEDTADILAGTMNAMRVNGVQQLAVAQSGLSTLIKIEANTALTKTVIEVLKNIDGKISTGSQFTSNRASGR